MKRTTIFIPETLERDLQLYARRAGRPVASVVREAVEQYLTHASAAGILLVAFIVRTWRKRPLVAPAGVPRSVRGAELERFRDEARRETGL